MAEVIAALGVAASVAQLADYGFKLSVKLFSYSQAVSQADTSIKGISNDVSLTSTILQELCGILKSDGNHVVSVSAVEATQQTVRECLHIFEELSAALDKSLETLGVAEKEKGGKVKKGRVSMERLKWPFKQPKMELLRSNLDRLKASLTLMLQVLSYARSISSLKEMESSFEYQKHLIESLACSERATRFKYHELQRAIENKSTDEDFDVTTSTSVTTQEKGLDFESLINRSPPEAKPKVTIGELLLCFQLLNELLKSHLAIFKSTERSPTSCPAIYEEFSVHLENLNRAELQRLEKEHGGASRHMKVEAAIKLQARLDELANASEFVMKKVTMENSRPTRFYALQESYSIGRTGESISVIDEMAERSLSYVEKEEAVRERIEREEGRERLARRPNLAHEKGSGLDPEESSKSLWYRVVDNIIGTSKDTTSSPASHSMGVSSASVSLAGPAKRHGNRYFEGEGENIFSYRISEEVEEEIPENIVQNLLSEWTTLPLQEQDSTKQASE